MEMKQDTVLATEQHKAEFFNDDVSTSFSTQPVLSTLPHLRPICHPVLISIITAPDEINDLLCSISHHCSAHEVYANISSYRFTNFAFFCGR